MLLSKACEYGIRAALFLTSSSEEGYVSVRKISKELDISFHFLTKILQKLSQAGHLRSFRGPKGGVALARPAHEVSLRDLVVAIDGPELFEQCVLGLPGCGKRRPCPMHESWGGVRAQLESMLEGQTLSDLAEKIRSEGLRLTASLE